MARAYVNARVYTMKNEGDTVEAFIIEDGKFFFCGSSDEAMRLIRAGRESGIWPDAEIVDLHGKCVLPGLIDDHQHVQTYARGLLKVDLTDACSVGEVKDLIRAQAEKTAPGKLILGSGFDQTKFAEHRLPTRWDLDEAAPANPVVITRYCLHINIANSLALEKGGIFDKDDVPHGIERGENGKLTGCMQEREAAVLINTITDGSLGGRTALMTQPYADDPGNTGACHYSQEELDKMVKEAYDRRLQTAVHAIGDKACEMTLLALKRAHDADPRPWDEVRFRLTHCSLINDNIIALLREMPMLIDMQPGYVSTNIHWSDDRVGERAPYLFAWKTLMGLGQRLCGSSDLPCENLNPLVGVYAVETRSGYDGYLPEGWQPQESLTRYEAVSLYTKNPAYASFEEDLKGTIEVGKLADFAVFDRDIFAVPAPELLQAQVERTVLGGKEVYMKK